MDPKSFYNSLWDVKSQADYRPVSRRDWFHRFVLDPILDPTANPRYEVALGLLHGGQRLLDVGCWDGYLLERIRGAGLYEELYGVDFVPEGIEAVRAKGFQAQVVDLNHDSLPFPDGHFDGVTMLAVLEHVFDPHAVVREVHRVSRPGGDLVIDVPNVASFTNRVRTEVLEHTQQPFLVMQEFARVLKPGGHLLLSVPFFYPVHEAPHDYWRFTAYGLEAICQSAGLTPIYIHPKGGMGAALVSLWTNLATRGVNLMSKLLGLSKPLRERDMVRWLLALLQWMYLGLARRQRKIPPIWAAQLRFWMPPGFVVLAEYPSER